ncbi:FadR/GntR family transcriptional regulator [Pedobacter sp. L105]|uniref:FadR/GntR family transcriptional regulator n=1 Tax=Pedobacter sp. L105 TaxID=1641871 RepID=UPI00131DE3A4|nr:FadR/GntR family transcriptional regulator [Pedobacter sp. L105]
MSELIVRKSLSEVVAERLQEQIVSGAYKLEQQLPTEPELMKEFGVGRSSIREAIRKLENIGTVRVQQGVGTFVASKNTVAEPLSKRLHTARDKDVEEVRELLELKIVEKAALNRTKKDIANIQSCLEKRNKAADQNNLALWLEEDINFHISIAEACKNPILVELYKTFAEQQLKKSIGDQYAAPISMHRLTLLHKELLESIIEQDTEKAVKISLTMHKKP